MTVKESLEAILRREGDTIEQATEQRLLYALLEMVKEREQDLRPAAGARKLYYFSAEFLIGRLLRANLINLGLLEEVEQLLAENKRTLAEVEEAEPEPSLGNGGLGRLAACFLDSIASLGLCGDGVGLNYHYGLFRQEFEACKQVERPDPWLEPGSWLEDTGLSFPVAFGDRTLDARLFDLRIPGFRNGVGNRLHLFDVGQPAPPPGRGIDFDKQDVEHCLTAFLYPDDSDEAGRLLRLYQQYFLVAAGVQLILYESEQRGVALEELDRHVVIHINDTHPSMVIPELIRALAGRGIDFDCAVGITERICAYTNHTILAEALEKWPLAFLERVAPALVPVIRQLAERAAARSDDPATAIIDHEGLVHMARMDIHFSFCVNGVAALHTEILKNTELHPFYRLYPQKFCNKTNGITLRRWLMGCNAPLSALIQETIGSEWERDGAALARLADYRADGAFLARLLEAKEKNKKTLAQWLYKTRALAVDPFSVFDIQIKRLHQYKRQQMNALYAIWKYRQIKQGRLPRRPLTMIFGAKAAPAYTLAKDIIHLILCLHRLVDSDPQVCKWLNIVMVENYNVSAAERLIPACDLSEQISLASKEASGTGNMKLMANGAVTLGTMDGANVEIADLVGRENIYIFGRSSEEVIGLYRSGGYRSSDYWQDPAIGELIDFIISPAMLSVGDPASLGRLYKDFLVKDYFMALLDLRDFIRVKEQALDDFEDRMAWAGKMTINIAQSGYFSSDRTIREYNDGIWRL